MRLFLDADACPVREEALKVAARYDVPVTIVSNGGMRPSRDPLIDIVIVPKTPDAADDWIAENLATGDIVVTQDIPLAKRALEGEAFAIGPTGRVFDTDSIGLALARREINQHIREATQGQTRHRPHSSSDKSRFLQELDRLIVQNRPS